MEWVLLYRKNIRTIYQLVDIQEEEEEEEEEKRKIEDEESNNHKNIF